MLADEFIQFGPSHIDRELLIPRNASYSFRGKAPTWELLNAEAGEGQHESMFLFANESRLTKQDREEKRIENERIRLIQRQLDMQNLRQFREKRKRLEAKAGLRNNIKESESSRLPCFEKVIRPVVKLKQVNGKVKPLWQTTVKHDSKELNEGWRDAKRSTWAYKKIKEKTIIEEKKQLYHMKMRKEKINTIREEFRKQKYKNDARNAHIEAVFIRPKLLLQSRSMSYLKQALENKGEPHYEVERTLNHVASNRDMSLNDDIKCTMPTLLLKNSSSISARLDMLSQPKPFHATNAHSLPITLPQKDDSVMNLNVDMKLMEQHDQNNHNHHHIHPLKKGCTVCAATIKELSPEAMHRTISRHSLGKYHNDNNDNNNNTDSHASLVLSYFNAPSRQNNNTRPLTSTDTGRTNMMSRGKHQESMNDIQEFEHRLLKSASGKLRSNNSRSRNQNNLSVRMTRQRN